MGKLLAIMYDPRAKMIAIVVFSFLSVYIKNIYLLGMLTLLCLILAYYLKAELWEAIKKLRKIIGMLLAIAILQSIFNQKGNVLLRTFSIPLITDDGLEKGGEFLLRMTTIISSATIIGTSNTREIIQGLIQLKVPYDLAFIITLGIRFLPILKEEIHDTFTALKLRGVVFKHLSIKEKIHIYSYLFLPVIAGVIKKSQKIAISMTTKGFKAKDNRTSYLRLTFSRRDYYLVVVSLFIFVGFVYFYVIKKSLS